MSGPTFGFNFDYVTNPVARSEFAQFISALQKFVESFNPIFVPYAELQLSSRANGTILSLNGPTYHLWYRVIGGIMEVSFNIPAFATAAALEELWIVLPPPYKAIDRGVAVAGQMQFVSDLGSLVDNGNLSPGIIYIYGGTKVIRIVRSDGAGWANTAGAYTSRARGMISFPVQVDQV